MAIFIFGLILFLSVHSIGIFADQWRAIQINKFGNRKYKFLYSFLSLAGLVLMTIGYKQHTYIADIAIWSAPWINPLSEQDFKSPLLYQLS